MGVLKDKKAVCTICKRMHTVDQYCPRRVSDALIGIHNASILTESDKKKIGEIKIKYSIGDMIEYLMAFPELLNEIEIKNCV